MAPLPNILPDLLLGHDQHSFTLAEAKATLERDDDAIRKGLERLARKGEIFPPSRSFYVVVPPEFRSWGTVPAAHFIDDLMRFLHRRYYVALLSAAELHGAAHQAPQVFQVMVARHLRDRDLGRTRLRFFAGAHVADAPVEQRNVPTGHIRLASHELPPSISSSTPLPRAASTTSPPCWANSSRSTASSSPPRPRRGPVASRVASGGCSPSSRSTSTSSRCVVSPRPARERQPTSAPERLVEDR